MTNGSLTFIRDWCGISRWEPTHIWSLSPSRYPLFDSASPVSSRGIKVNTLKKVTIIPSYSSDRRVTYPRTYNSPLIRSFSTPSPPHQYRYLSIRSTPSKPFRPCGVVRRCPRPTTLFGDYIFRGLKEYSAASLAKMSPNKVLVYLLRRDLRLADNPIFHEIQKLAQSSQCPFTHLLPIYIFPAQQVEISGFLSDPSSKSPYPAARSETGSFWRCGPFRARFLAESVWDLKKDLDTVKSDLIFRVGMPGQVVKDLLQAFKKQEDAGSITAIWMTAEEGVEEKREERDVKRVSNDAGIDFRLFRDEKYFIDE